MAVVNNSKFTNNRNKMHIIIYFCDLKGTLKYATETENG